MEAKRHIQAKIHILVLASKGKIINLNVHF